MEYTPSSFFQKYFQALSNGLPAYPWQEALYSAMVSGNPWPDTVSMPTGAGKTAILKIWLIALAWSLLQNKPRSIPRRLFWVVNRRVVVDQTSDEADQIQSWLKSNQSSDLAQALLNASFTKSDALAVSKLRGEVDDNRQWSRDPLMAAIIVGTVDMIGSRLLFRGYRDGIYFRSKNAGLIGIDSLIVNDESHLSPAFATLLKNVEALNPAGELAQYGHQFKILLVSATERASGKRKFEHDLSIDLANSEHFRKVLRATKRLWLQEASSGPGVIDSMVRITLEKQVPRTILFVESPEEALKVADRIEKNVGGDNVALLTGTMRGYERIKDQESGEVFKRFRNPQTPPGRSFLVATSAGEVGVNMTSELLLTSLVESDRLLQRFGRLNRFGTQVGEPEKIGNAYVISLAQKGDGQKSAPDARQLTLQYLQSLTKFDDGSYDISCEVLSLQKPPPESWSKTPAMARLSPQHIEVWAQTSAPGRTYDNKHQLTAAMPDIASWLHGKQEDDFAETSVAWRDEVEYLVDVSSDEMTRALEKHRVRSHEKLTEPSTRLCKKMAELAAIHQNERVLFQRRNGDVEVMTLAEFAQQNVWDLNEGILLLRPKMGKLFKGMLRTASNASGVPALDVADTTDNFLGEELRPRKRLIITKEFEKLGRINIATKEAEVNEPLTQRLKIELTTEQDEFVNRRRWLAFYTEPARCQEIEIALDKHSADVSHAAEAIAGKSVNHLATMYADAGEKHDIGKAHTLWQLAMVGKAEPKVVLAKTKKAANAALLAGFRHELRSVLELGEGKDDLLIHLIASHHGWARPYWQAKAYDPEHLDASAKAAQSAIDSFALLQKRWGPWALAYLEALLKSADGICSEGPAKNGA